MVHPATVNTNRSSILLTFLTGVYSALLLSLIYKLNQTMTQFCGKTLYHLQHASVDQPISNFRKKHHKYVRKKKHQWNKKLNTFNLAITDTETSTNQIVEIMHKFHLTMVDQKVFNALTDTNSSMRCYICNFPHPKNDTYKYVISPLHKWIRCFEMFIHISYRIEVQRWQISSPEDQARFCQEETRTR